MLTEIVYLERDLNIERQRGKKEKGEEREERERKREREERERKRERGKKERGQ